MLKKATCITNNYIISIQNTKVFLFTYTNIKLAQKHPGLRLLVNVPEGELSNCRPSSVMICFSVTERAVRPE